MEWLKQIEELTAGREFRFMEFCGGHTYVLAKSGMLDVLPKNIKMIHGPGCPVCVLPSGRINMALALLNTLPNVILCTYGDVLKVPNAEGFSLANAKAQGADVKAVYSVMDALSLALENRCSGRKIVFFAVGFETTSPLTAYAVLKAREMELANFFILNNHILTYKAMESIFLLFKDKKLGLDGVIAPGNVCVITGYEKLEFLADKYKIPMVVSGFQEDDLLQSIRCLCRLVRDEKSIIINQYKRALTKKGNVKAMDICSTVFSNYRDFEWRGLGKIKDSALDFAEVYYNFDAERVFDCVPMSDKEPLGCICPLVITGQKEPKNCPLIGKECNPRNPKGACMVSSEGACGAFWKYKRKE